MSYPDILALGEAMIEFNQIEPGQRQYLQGYGGDTSNVAIAAALTDGNSLPALPSSTSSVVTGPFAKPAFRTVRS